MPRPLPGPMPPQPCGSGSAPLPQVAITWHLGFIRRGQTCTAAQPCIRQGSACPTDAMADASTLGSTLLPSHLSQSSLKHIW